MQQRHDGSVHAMSRRIRDMLQAPAAGHLQAYAAPVFADRGAVVRRKCFAAAAVRGAPRGWPAAHSWLEVDVILVDRKHQICEHSIICSTTTSRYWTFTASRSLDKSHPHVHAVVKAPQVLFAA